MPKKSVTQAQLIAQVAERTEKTKKEVAEIIKALEDIVLELLKKGYTVRFGKLGSFEIHYTPKKKFRLVTPQGEYREGITKGGYKIVFKTSRKARRYLNEGEDSAE